MMTFRNKYKRLFIYFSFCSILFPFHPTWVSAVFVHLSHMFIHWFLCKPCIICWFNWQIWSATIFAPGPLRAICLKQDPFNFKALNESNFDQFLSLFSWSFVKEYKSYFGSNSSTHFFYVVLNISTLSRLDRIISKWTDDNRSWGRRAGISNLYGNCH